VAEGPFDDHLFSSLGVVVAVAALLLRSSRIYFEGLDVSLQLVLASNDPLDILLEDQELGEGLVTLEAQLVAITTNNIGVDRALLLHITLTAVVSRVTEPDGAADLVRHEHEIDARVEEYQLPFDQLELLLLEGKDLFDG